MVHESHVIQSNRSTRFLLYRGVDRLGKSILPRINEVSCGRFGECSFNYDQLETALKVAWKRFDFYPFLLRTQSYKRTLLSFARLQRSTNDAAIITTALYDQLLVERL